MSIVVSYKPLYEDGTEDDGQRHELVLAGVESDSAAVLGAFLLDGVKLIGTVDEDGTSCDALDVTISRSS
jgi:hypothetical protein